MKRTLFVSKRKLIHVVLIVAAVVGIGFVCVDVAGRLRKASAAVDGVEAAAAHAIGEALCFDHAEGQEDWAERVEPLCTETGWAFWQLVAAQTWPDVVAQEYAVQDVEVLDAEVTEEIDDRLVVSVRLRIEYVQGSESFSEQKTYPVVMVEQDGRWLMDVDDRAFGGQ